MVAITLSVGFKYELPFEVPERDGIMFRTSCFTLFVALAVLAAWPVRSAPAQGDVLYGMRGDSTLVRIDTSTLAATTLGPAGFTAIGGLAFGNDGTLYGMATSNDVLLRIDLQTGAGTTIGAVGAPVTFSTGLGNDPVSDLLFGITQQGSGASSYLVTCSKTTGQASPVGDTGTSAVVGLGFDATGQLWGIDGGGGHEELIKIDKTTGQTVVVGAQGLAAYSGVGCFDIGPSGTFWAINASGSSYQLIRINPATGAPILVGTLTGITTSGGLTGLASFAAVRIVASGSPRPGSTITLTLTSSHDAGLTYQVGSSLGTGPIPIDQRSLGLSPDDLLVVSVGGLWPFIFAGYRGVLDAQGRAQASIHVPNIPVLVGQRIHSAFVTLSPTAPSGIQSISNTESFTITK